MISKQFGELKAELEHSYYPKEFAGKFEGLECFSSSDGYETLLVKEKKTGRLCIAKCYSVEHPLYGHTEPEEIKSVRYERIPQYIGEYKDGKTRCVVREYIKGKTLDEIARERLCADQTKGSNKSIFSEEEICSFIRQILDILETLHSNDPPVIHRDIKPQNIVLSEDGKVYLIDFGISKIISNDNSDTTTIFGTRDFAPPEQYGFSETDERSDIYSLGVLFRWLVYGDVKKKPDNTGRFDSVIEKCTAFDPKDRFRSVSEVRNELKKTDPAYKRKHIACISGIIAVCVLLVFIGIRAIVSNGSIIPDRSDILEIDDPLIETAVLYNLDKKHGHISKDEALLVTEIFIVYDKAFSTEEEFYDGIKEWYSKNRNSRGTIVSIDDLANFPNLKKVCIVGQKIRDISVLSNCDQLEKVELKHNQIEDISALGELSDLGSVGMNDNPVKDIYPLTKLDNLRFLDLCDSGKYEGSAFKNMGDFEYLDISNCTDSYKYLAGKSVKRLCVNYTDMDSFEYLKEIEGLEELEIACNFITDVSGLLEMDSLKRIRTTSKIKDMIKELGSVPFEVY